MKNKWKLEHRMESVFTLSLFLVFTLSMTMVMAIGAGVYQRIAAGADANFEERVGTAYIANKVRSCDSAGMVAVEDREGIPVLVLTEDVEGTLCETLIYCLDGSIRELFVKKDTPLPLDAGLAIYEAEGAAFSLEEDLLQITVETAGGPQTQYVAIRSGK